jgi:hypothetical protein
MGYVGTVLARPDAATMALRGAQRLWKGFQEWHPVLPFFGLLGTLFFAPRSLRRWLLPVFVVLGALAGLEPRVEAVFATGAHGDSDGGGGGAARRHPVRAAAGGRRRRDAPPPVAGGPRPGRWRRRWCWRRS